MYFANGFWHLRLFAWRAGLPCRLAWHAAGCGVLCQPLEHLFVVLHFNSSFHLERTSQVSAWQGLHLAFPAMLEVSGRSLRPIMICLSLNYDVCYAINQTSSTATLKVYLEMTEVRLVRLG